MTKREPPIDTLRRTGRTTRHADKIIQSLFKDDTAFFIDHAYQDGNHATEMLARKVINRIRLEHPHRTVCARKFANGWYGITIKYVEGKKEEAMHHLDQEFREPKYREKP